MKTNVKSPGGALPRVATLATGMPAVRTDAEAQLRRAVMACLLWEDTFYLNGKDISENIASLIPQVDPKTVYNIALEARLEQKLRHVPLFIISEMCKYPQYKPYVGEALRNVINRADEMAEFLAIYWKNGKVPIAAQVKKGLAACFHKFNEYAFAKYQGTRDQVKLRDVLRLVHPVPLNKDEEKLFGKIKNETLDIPDTWEVALSGGEDKKQAWERLLSNNQLGGLALLRNLRNMYSVRADENLIKNAIRSMNVERILPFRFITAAKYAPALESVLEEAMLKCLAGANKLPGRTVLLIDVSGSMDWAISSKSELLRMDAACGLAILARELCSNVAVYTFSNDVVRVPDRHGFALRDAIVNSQRHASTYLGRAVKHINDRENYDRIIVLTDEQSHDKLPNPTGLGYVINVSAEKNGIGYKTWLHIDGWSEAVFTYITALEGSD